MKIKLILIMKKNIILIDDSTNNLTNLILFKNFLKQIIKEKKILIMTGNKEFSQIYETQLITLCDSFKIFLNKNFIKLECFPKSIIEREN